MTVSQGAEPSNGAAEHVRMNPDLVPIVEVAFWYDKWWSIPQDMSRQLYERYVAGEDAGYTWDWGEGGRRGSWAPDGEETRINRYTIDFVAMVQEFGYRSHFYFIIMGVCIGSKLNFLYINCFLFFPCLSFFLLLFVLVLTVVHYFADWWGGIR